MTQGLDKTHHSWRHCRHAGRELKASGAAAISTGERVIQAAHVLAMARNRESAHMHVKLTCAQYCARQFPHFAFSNYIRVQIALSHQRLAVHGVFVQIEALTLGRIHLAVKSEKGVVIPEAGHLVNSSSSTLGRQWQFAK